MHKFSAVVQIMPFFGAFWKNFINFGANLALNFKDDAETASVNTVFGTYLVSNIGTKS